MAASGPLAGIVVIDISVNLPGPLASARLCDLGAAVTKIEPPAGDPLQAGAPRWYEELCRGKQRETLDLKAPEDRERMVRLLDQADLLLTSSRPRSLMKLGLDWDTLHSRHSRLCQVAIVGHAAPHADLPGHDLTYLAGVGLLERPESLEARPAMPRSLIADIGGAERAASSALALLLARERTGEAGYLEVALADAAHAFAAPLRHGLTSPGGGFGGGYPPYNLYATADGWVAIAALEPSFWTRFVTATARQDLADPLAGAVMEEVRALFRTRTTAAWLDLAKAHDLPIAEVLDVVP